MVSRRSDSDLSKAQLYYDSSTGQVYTEAVVSAKSGKGRGSWSLPRLKRVRETSGGHGAPSLERIALHAVVDNIYGLQPETIENVPWPVRRRIWDTCERSDDVSHDVKFHLWKTIIESQAPLTSRESSTAYRRMCKEDTIHERLAPLPDLLASINSPTTAWLTALTLSRLYFPREHLYQLSKLHNLVALDICAPSDLAISSALADPFSRGNGKIVQPLVDDLVLKNLARHVNDQSAYQSLRVVILRGFKDVTSGCLEYLNSFPRLSLFGVQNCRLGSDANALRDDEKRARACGWTIEDERGLLGQLKHEIERSRTWDGMLKACVEMTAVFTGKTRDTSPPTQSQQTLSEWRENVRKQDQLRHRQQQEQEDNMEVDLPPHVPDPPQPQQDPPLLNFKIGPTCSDLIFSTPMVFFRCLNGHIQEEAKACPGSRSTSPTLSRKHSHRPPRSESKNRRPSAHDPRAAKRPKLRAGRSVPVADLLEISGVGRRLSSIELEQS